MKIMEQPMRIPSCVVLGAGQRAQTLAFLTLARWPQVSGLSLPYSGSAPGANTFLLEGPVPSSQTTAWIPRGLESLMQCSQRMPSPIQGPRGQPEKNLISPYFSVACPAKLQVP